MLDAVCWWRKCQRERRYDHCVDPRPKTRRALYGFARPVLASCYLRLHGRLTATTCCSASRPNWRSACPSYYRESRRAVWSKRRRPTYETLPARRPPQVGPLRGADWVSRPAWAAGFSRPRGRTSGSACRCIAGSITRAEAAASKTLTAVDAAPDAAGRRFVIAGPRRAGGVPGGTCLDLRRLRGWGLRSCRSLRKYSTSRCGVKRGPVDLPVTTLYLC